MCQHVAAQRNVCVQGAGSADAQDVQGLVHGLDFAGLEVHVGQGVQLGHDDVDIVRADAMGQRGDALAVALAGDGNEFTGFVTEFYVCEVFSDHVHAGRIADHDDVICQFFGFQMDVKHGTVAIDDEFRFRDSHSIN